MRRALILLSFAIILLVAAANVYRDPRVQDLFRSVPGAGSAKIPVVGPTTRSSPEQPPRPGPSSSPVAAKRNGVVPQERDVVAARANQTPNEKVSRVLLQILSAKGLSRGISLEVSDESVKVFGEVDSYDKRQTIVSLIEKIREGRRLDATGLSVQR